MSGLGAWIQPFLGWMMHWNMVEAGPLAHRNINALKSIWSLLPLFRLLLHFLLIRSIVYIALAGLGCIQTRNCELDGFDYDKIKKNVCDFFMYFQWKSMDVPFDINGNATISFSIMSV